MAIKPGKTTGAATALDTRWRPVTVVLDMYGLSLCSFLNRRREREWNGGMGGARRKEPIQELGQTRPGLGLGEGACALLHAPPCTERSIMVAGRRYRQRSRRGRAGAVIERERSSDWTGTGAGAEAEGGGRGKVCGLKTWMGTVRVGDRLERNSQIGTARPDAWMHGRTERLLFLLILILILITQFAMFIKALSPFPRAGLQIIRTGIVMICQLAGVRWHRDGNESTKKKI